MIFIIDKIFWNQNKKVDSCILIFKKFSGNLKHSLSTCKAVNTSVRI